MNRIFFLLLLVSAFGAGCKSPSKVSARTEPGRESELPLSYGEKRKLDVAFTDGVIQKLQGNYKEAVDHFKKCIDVYPNHSASYYEIGFILSQLGRSAEAIPFAQKAVSLEEKNAWYRMLYSKCLMEANKFTEAADSYEKLVKLNPKQVDYYFMWSTALLHANKSKEALEVYNKIESMIGITEELILQKERLYLSLNQLDKAVAEGQKLIDSDPGEPRYYRMLSDLYLQNNKADKAEELWKKIFEIDPDDAETHLMMADHYREKGDEKRSQYHLKKAFANSNLNIDHKVKILVSYLNLPDKFKEERIFSDSLMAILLKAHPNDARSHSLQGDFYNRDGKKKEARDAFKKAISFDNTRFPIWQEVMILDEALGDFDAMESDSRQAMELFPSEPYPYIFNASANYQMKKYEKAIEAVQNGKDYVAGDKKLLAQFYSILGDCYNNLKDYKKSDEAYEKTINLDPENANIMNNWAYYLSLRNEQLEKAERMARKANQLVKDNSSYEDTYAWVLFKLKQYEEAKRWQEKAIEHGGEKNGTLLEHYGDILFQLGQTDKAMEYWKKAKETGRHSDLLDKKIAEKKLVE